MTIYDISEKAGVSIATVSRVLNGTNNVSEKTRQKVLKIIEESGYTPNAFARGLGLNTMNTIGIMCADSSDLYLAKAIYYIERELRAKGYNCLLSCTGYDLETKSSSLNLLLSKKVDSIILVGSNFIYENPEDNKYILDAAAQVPVMLLNATLDAPGVYCTLTDDYASEYEATDKMIRSGIKDLLHFYNSNTFSGRRKRNGFLDAMQTHGICPSDDHTLFFDGIHEDIPAITECLRNHYNSGHSFRGIIAADDYLAIGAIRFAQEVGLKIPQDLCVVGFNNSMLVNCCQPPLSSIDSRLDELCNDLTAKLMDILEGKDVPTTTLHKSELVERDTTCF